MTTEYDVNIPRNQFGNGKNATLFWDFYESEHQTVKHTFDTKEQAYKLYKSVVNIITRNPEINAYASVRKNVVYFSKI